MPFLNGTNRRTAFGVIIVLLLIIVVLGFFNVTYFPAENRLLQPSNQLTNKQSELRNVNNSFGAKRGFLSTNAEFDSASSAKLQEEQKTFSDSEIEVARHIMDFIRTGKMEKIRDLPRGDIANLIETYLSETPLAQVAESMEGHLGIPPEIFYSSSTPEDYLTELFDATLGELNKPEISPNIIFTDSCATDGSVLGSTHILPGGTDIVFAVFENQGALNGLDQVYAIWRNLDDDAMQYSKYELLRIGSRYNYIWLNLDKGWKEGCYQLDLADPVHPSRILASSKFKVK